MKTLSYPVKTRSPASTPISGRAQAGKFSNVCSWLNNSFWKASFAKKSKSNHTKSKKMWTQSNASPKPKKIKQLRIVDGTSLHSDVKELKEAKEVQGNLKHIEKKSVQKLGLGVCSSTIQKYHPVKVQKPKANFSFSDKSEVFSKTLSQMDSQVFLLNLVF